MGLRLSLSGGMERGMHEAPDMIPLYPQRSAAAHSAVAAPASSLCLLTTPVFLNEQPYGTRTEFSRKPARMDIPSCSGSPP